MPTWVWVTLGGSGCALAALLTVALGWLWRRYRRYRRASDREVDAQRRVVAAATELGLRETSDGVFEGKVGGRGASRRVRWTLREVPHGELRRLQLALGTPVPTGQLAVTHRTMLYGVEPEELDLPLCRSGDADFDVRFYVHADLEHLSILTPPVRQALLHAADDAEVRVRDGWLWVDHEATPEQLDGLPERLDRLVRAADVLDALPTEVEQRVRRLSQDDNARVRGRTLELLEERGESEFTTWIARALLSDSDRHVRARAAAMVGDAEQLVALAGDEKAPIEVRTRVARAMVDVGTERDKLAAAKGLATGPMPLPTLCVDLCRAVGAEAEAVLIDLVHTGSGSAVRSAVATLGQVGSARSLVVLQALVDGAASDGVIRGEARAALDRLRSNANRRKSSTPPFSSTPPRPAARGEETRIRPAPRGPAPVEPAPRAGPRGKPKR